MWMAIGVGILVMSQASATAAGGERKAPATVTSADESAPATEAPTTPVGAETTLRFRNDVGDGFLLSEARFALDGRDLPTVLTSVEHAQGYIFFAGPIAPGRHVLISHLTYQGRNRSIFTYLKGYTFNLDSTHELNIPEGGTMTATVVGRRDKGFNVPYERSLVVEFEQPAMVGAANMGAHGVSTGPGGAR